jgi:hypothetical protein
MIKEEETFVYPNQLSLLLKFDSQLTAALFIPLHLPASAYRRATFLGIKLA